MREHEKQRQGQPEHGDGRNLLEQWQYGHPEFEQVLSEEQKKNVHGIDAITLEIHKKKDVYKIKEAHRHCY